MAGVNDPRPFGLQQPIVFYEVAITGSTSISDVTTSPTLSVGSGSPNGSLTRPQGSLYIDKAGASGDAILFVNTDGSTAWEAGQFGGAGSDAIADTNTYYTTDTINGAFDALALQIGGLTDATFSFTENNALANDDAIYAALEKLDLKWGDLASTANGEGAALVGIEDSGGIITATDVEGALAENRTAIDLNTTHASSDGSDHTYIDQDVTSGSSPTFAVTNFTGSAAGIDSDATTHAASDGSSHTYIDQDVTSGSSPTLDSTNFTGPGGQFSITDTNAYFDTDTVDDALDQIANWGIRRAAVTIPGGTGAGTVGSLNSTPVTVIAAPPAGAYIEVLSAHVWLDYTSAAYDGVGAGEKFGLYFDGGDLVTNEIDGVGWADQGSDQHAYIAPADSYAPEAATAITAEVANGDWYAAAGDSPLKLEIYYRLRNYEFTV